MAAEAGQWTSRQDPDAEPIGTVLADQLHASRQQLPEESVSSGQRTETPSTSSSCVSASSVRGEGGCGQSVTYTVRLKAARRRGILALWLDQKGGIDE